MMPMCRVAWVSSGISGSGSFFGVMIPYFSEVSIDPCRVSSTIAVSSMNR